jgi:hypothetical protein
MDFRAVFLLTSKYLPFLLNVLSVNNLDNLIQIIQSLNSDQAPELQIVLLYIEPDTMLQNSL